MRPVKRVHRARRPGGDKRFTGIMRRKVFGAYLAIILVDSINFREPVVKLLFVVMLSFAEA